MGHQAEAFLGIYQEDQIRRMGAQFLGRGARDQRSRMHGSRPGSLADNRFALAAVRAKTAMEVPHRLAGAACLKGDAVAALGPVENGHDEAASITIPGMHNSSRRRPAAIAAGRIPIKQRWGPCFLLMPPPLRKHGTTARRRRHATGPAKLFSPAGFPRGRLTVCGFPPGAPSRRRRRNGHRKAGRHGY